MREVSGVAHERLITQAEGREVDCDGLACGEHHLRLSLSRPDQHDSQGVTRDVLTERPELPEQMAEQLRRIRRVDELFHPQRRPAAEGRRAALRRRGRVNRVDRVGRAGG